MTWCLRRQTWGASGFGLPSLRGEEKGPMSTTRGRLVYSNQVVYDQADFFQLDGFTRVPGLTPMQVTSELYFNNTLQPWALVTGLNVLDPQIAAGKIYWLAIPGGPYGVRFRPNAVGYWR